MITCSGGKHIPKTSRPAPYSTKKPDSAKSKTEKDVAKVKSDTNNNEKEESTSTADADAS